MARKVAAISAVLAFAACVIQGIVADNTIATTLARAMLAMCGTFVVGLVIGAMAAAMWHEHEQKLHATQPQSTGTLENPGTKTQDMADKRK